MDIANKMLLESLVTAHRLSACIYSDDPVLYKNLNKIADDFENKLLVAEAEEI